MGPLSKTMQKLNRLTYIAQHFATSRKGTIGQLDHLTFWPECIPYLDLRSDYFAAVRYLDSNGFNLPDKSQIRSMRREGMQRYIDKADDARAASSILSHLKVNGKLLSKEEKRSRQRAQRQQQRES